MPVKSKNKRTTVKDYQTIQVITSAISKPSKALEYKIGSRQLGEGQLGKLPGQRCMV